MGRKALQALEEEMNEEVTKRFNAYYESAIYYNKAIGNIYTVSLYLSLLSLLEQAEELPNDARIGLFSYGSGAVGEYFVGKIKTNYIKYLQTATHEELLNNRIKLSIEEYEYLMIYPFVVEELGNASFTSSEVI